MTVTVNRGSLAAGEYSGQITFIVGEETVIVPIKLIIPAKSCPMVSFDAVKNVASVSYTHLQLEYILAVNQFRHFAKAAEHCRVTQPTLSAMIQKLEDELDTCLLYTSW